MGVLRARRCHLRAGFQECKSFVEMCTVRSCQTLLLFPPRHSKPFMASKWARGTAGDRQWVRDAYRDHKIQDMVSVKTGTGW